MYLDHPQRHEGDVSGGAFRMSKARGSFDQMPSRGIVLIDSLPIGFLDLKSEIPNISETERWCLPLVGKLYADVVSVIFVLDTPFVE